MVDLLFKVIVSQEQDCFPIVQDTLGICKILLDVLPQDDMLSSRVIQSSWNGSDSSGRFGPERLLEGSHVAGCWKKINSALFELVCLAGLSKRRITLWSPRGRSLIAHIQGNAKSAVAVLPMAL